MFGNKKKRRKSRLQSANAAMNWIIIGMVGLAFLNHYRNKNSDITESLTNNSTLKSLQSSTMVELKNYKNKILPSQPTILTVQDIEIGSGAPALCGQTLSIAYKTYLEDGTELDDAATTDKPYSFTIGEKKAMPALEEGLVGMKKGGTRKLLSPPHEAYAAPGFTKSGMPENTNVSIEVQLLDITPPLPDPAEFAYRFMDVRKGLGPTALCGQPMQAEITVWAMDGSKLFTTKPAKDAAAAPITVTPGSSTHFLGLEHGILGIKPGGIRTAVVPPLFQKTLHDTPDSLNIPFPKDQTVLVDIESVP